jgi:hypothetical protein
MSDHGSPDNKKAPEMRGFSYFKCLDLPAIAEPRITPT